MTSLSFFYHRIPLMSFNLDISIFSPIKTAYHCELALCGFDDSTPVGKSGFLRCYALARASGLTNRNIRSGWLGSE